MIRFYILPIEQVVDGATTYRGPKYFDWRRDPDPPALVSTRYALMDYGLINACLIVADVTQEQHDLLVANSDVASPPEDIDQNITTQALPQVQNVLEALRIPTGWIDTTYTYREILRRVAGLFQFAQRHHGMHDEQLIDNTGQLDLTWADISVDRRTRVQMTADSFGYDYSTVTGTWTVRQTLMHLANQWGATPIYIGGITL